VSVAFGRGRGDRKFVFALMEPRDVPAVVELERAAFSNPWTAEVFERELGLPFSKIVLARAGEEVVGYVCHWISEDAVEVQNVAVHPTWRRRSIGRRLVAIALEDGRRAGAARALLEVRRHNYGAIALYEGLGFRETGLRPQYYDDGEDALLMELRFTR